MTSIAVVRPGAKVAALGAYIVLVEWTRSLVMSAPNAAAPALVLGGLALSLAAVGFAPARLGIERSRLGFRILGGLALGAVLVLPAAARTGGSPILPAGLAVAAIAVSIGEEIAFRGALYAALEDVGGPALAVVGSTALWTLAHALSHPVAFLGAVAAAGLVLGLWRWACRDLVGPVIGHVIADLAL